MGFFDKYDSVINKPNGRPVGVQNGMGQQPQQYLNPALSGMSQTQTPMAGSRPQAPSAGQPQQKQAFTFMDWAKLYGGK